MSARKTNTNLYVKSFFAASVPVAMEQARRELGDDALLLNSRVAPRSASSGRLRGGLREQGFVEDKVVAVGEERVASAPQAADIEDLRQKVEEIRSLLLRAGMTGQQTGTRRRVVEQALLEVGLTPALAAEIDGTMTVQDGDAAALVRETMTKSMLGSRLNRVSAITALVGPPGSGKTTTLVKLAIREGRLKADRCG